MLMIELARAWHLHGKKVRSESAHPPILRPINLIARSGRSAVVRHGDLRRPRRAHRTRALPDRRAKQGYIQTQSQIDLRPHGSIHQLNQSDMRRTTSRAMRIASNSKVGSAVP